LRALGHHSKRVVPRLNARFGRDRGPVASAPAGVRLTQRSVRVPAAMAAVIVALYFAWVIAYFGFDWTSSTGRNLFDLATESNVGTWLSGAVLLAASLVAALVACRAERADRRGWGVIAATLVLFSIDEVGAVHDAFNQDLSLRLETHGVLRYAWVIPAAVLVGALAIVVVPFVRRLPSAVARPITLAAVVFIGAAIGIELLEGWLDGRHDPASLGNTLVRGTQEILELVGALLGLSAMLGAAGHIDLSIGAPSRTSTRP
jgi:hypothetical protein